MLTALLPVRDGAATLDVALRSLFDQTRRPDRVVVVDDGSVDGTPQALARWPVEVIRTPGVGIAAALNAGLARALESGARWIARMDADDICRPERFATQLAFAEAEGLALVGCEVTHAGPEGYAGMREHVGWANARHGHDELALALWVDSPLPHPGWLVRREAWERVGLYDESGAVPEDYQWLHRFFAAARRGSLRAGKPRGELVAWTDGPTRLTRTGAAYREEAFHAVRAKALAALLAERPSRPRVHFVGMGRRGKGLFPYLQRELPIDGIVDVHAGRIGMRYRGVEIWDVDRWREERGDRLVVACLGTEEARRKAGAFFTAQGLVPGWGFLAL